MLERPPPACRRSSRCRRRWLGSRRACAASTPGRAAASSRAGSTTSIDHGVTSASVAATGGMEGVELRAEVTPRRRARVAAPEPAGDRAACGAWRLALVVVSAWGYWCGPYGVHCISAVIPLFGCVPVPTDVGSSSPWSWPARSLRSVPAWPPAAFRRCSSRQLGGGRRLGGRPRRPAAPTGSLAPSTAGSTTGRRCRPSGASGSDGSSDLRRPPWRLPGPRAGPPARHGRLAVRLLDVVGLPGRAGRRRP